MPQPRSTVVPRFFPYFAVVLIWCAGTSSSEDVPLPDFKTCMDIEVARYERELTWLHRRADAQEGYKIAGVQWVEYCGNIGITLCDRSNDLVGCQQALTETQESLRLEVLGQLRAPLVDAEQENFAAQLYANAWSIAHGGSAGQDCAGAEQLYQVWCEAREANGRLRNAVLAWQIARHLGWAMPAVEAGWARIPPPIRPKVRPGPGAD